MSHDKELEQRRLRRRIRSYVFAGVGVMFILVLILSLRDVQELLFPIWLIRSWGRVVAAFAVVAITAILLLPIVIEANLNPRRLSGPGRLPPPYRPPWDDPTLPKP
jgi:hypothetical protein